jgi:hypothetical protein
LKKGRDQRFFASPKNDDEGSIHYYNNCTYIGTSLFLWTLMEKKSDERGAFGPPWPLFS